MIVPLVARLRPLLRPIGFLFLIILAAVFVTGHRSDIRSAVDLIQHADGLWLVGVAGLQLSVLAVSVATYQLTLRLVGHRLSFWRLVDIHLQRHVVGVIAPLGGPASVYVFVRALGRRGISSTDALFVVALRGGVGSIAFATIVVPTVLVTDRSPLIVGAVGVLLAFTIVSATLTIALCAGAPLPIGSARLLPRRMQDFAFQARRHGVRMRDLALLFGLALVMNLGNVGLVLASMRAIRIDASTKDALTAFSVGNLLQTIAPVSQAVGVVEVSMAAAISQTGIARPEAIAATLLYRAADVWLPLLLGVTLYVFLQGISWVGRVRHRPQDVGRLEQMARLVVPFPMIQRLRPWRGGHAWGGWTPARISSMNVSAVVLLVAAVVSLRVAILSDHLSFSSPILALNALMEYAAAFTMHSIWFLIGCMSPLIAPSFLAASLL